MNKKEEKNISRRDALRYMGVGALGLAVASSGIEALASEIGRASCRERV